MKKETKGAARPPRKYNPNWQDNTRAERIQRRRDKLNQIARAAGFASWSAYETAIINKGSL